MSTELSDLETMLRVEQLSSEIVVHIYVYVKPSDPPKLAGVLPVRAPELVEIGLEEHDVESYWTVPSRRQMEEYRKEAAVLNRHTGTIMVDEMKLSDEVVINHLKRLLMDGGEVELKSHPTKPGRLLHSTLDRLKELHSGFYDTFYTQYRSEACLMT